MAEVEMAEIEIVGTLSPAMGVEVRLGQGADLTEHGAEELRRLFDEHHLLLMRGMELSRETHRVLVGHLGLPLLQSDHDQVSNLPGGLLGDYELAWHSDGSFTPEPYLGISLYASDLVDGTTSTRFANNVRAFGQLPPPLRGRLDGRRGSFSSPGHYDYGSAPRPHAAHPLVMAHPRTGVPLLYISRGHAGTVVDPDGLEEQELFEQLLDYSYAEDNIYEHWWHRRDLLIWDNLALQHSRPALSGSAPRILQRLVLAGGGTGSAEVATPGKVTVGKA